MNHLADETSPYLRQHSENPVDWYPWTKQAFDRAHTLDRPLLISIGYSACHWCHVMAHESFEDPATAALVNELFVPIKVDHEERPDVDAIYMEAVQAISGSGGWPLTIFATPEGKPFYGGTYYPPHEHGGRPSFTTLCKAIDDAWHHRRDDLETQSGQLTEAIAARLQPPEHLGAIPDAAVLLKEAYERYAQMFDPENGGVGDAPKFPQTPMLELMLRAHLAGHLDALAMVQTTLEAMASGGIYDHLGGGFARYSVDAAWAVPHFEKMLYDQASLARLYLHGFALTGDERWRMIAQETIAYVLRDLAEESGGIASAEDADSEGVEGKFYVFSRDDLDAIFSPQEAEMAAAFYGVSAQGNFEHQTTVLHRPERGELLRSDTIEGLRQRLYAARATRVRPAKDDKVLTEWNAMFGSVLCEAAGILGDAHLANEAEKLAQFLCEHLRRDDGRWLRSYQNGRVAHLAVSADYAWLVDFFTRLYELSGNNAWLDEALQSADQMIALFSADDGGLFTTGSDAEGLVVRPRETYDGVTPAAGSIAAASLVRLGALSARDDLVNRARALVQSAGAALVQGPIAFSHLVAAALELENVIEVVIPGERPDLVEAVRRAYLPGVVLAWGKGRDNFLWAGHEPGRAYVCRDRACLAPIDDVGMLNATLVDVARARTF